MCFKLFPIENFVKGYFTWIFTHRFQDWLGRFLALVLNLAPEAGQDRQSVQVQLILPILNLRSGNVQDCLRQVEQLWTDQDSGEFVLNLKLT